MLAIVAKLHRRAQISNITEAINNHRSLTKNIAING